MIPPREETLDRAIKEALKDAKPIYFEKDKRRYTIEQLVERMEDGPAKIRRLHEKYAK